MVLLIDSKVAKVFKDAAKYVELAGNTVQSKVSIMYLGRYSRLE